MSILADDAYHTLEGDPVGTEVNDDQFAITPMWLLDDKNISNAAFRMYAMLQSYANGRAGIVFPRRKTLANRLGWSLPTVDKAINELVEAGAVEVIPQYSDSGGQVANHYKVFSRAKRNVCDPVKSAHPPSKETLAPSQRNLGTNNKNQFNKTQLTRPKEPESVATKTFEVSESTDAEIIHLSPAIADDPPPKAEDTSQKRKHHSDSERLANLLADLIFERGCKKPKVTEAWISEIDRMIRIDDRKPVDIEGSIRWSHQDSFWALNILSPQKLRKQFDRLRMESQRGQSMNSKTNPVSTARIAAANILAKGGIQR